MKVDDRCLSHPSSLARTPPPPSRGTWERWLKRRWKPQWKGGGKRSEKSSGTTVEKQWKGGGKAVEKQWKGDGTTVEKQWNDGGKAVERRWKSSGKAVEKQWKGSGKAVVQRKSVPSGLLRTRPRTSDQPRPPPPPPPVRRVPAGTWRAPPKPSAPSKVRDRQYRGSG